MEVWKITAVVLLAAFAWELHVAKQDTKWRASYALEIAADSCKWLWYQLGRLWGKVCELIRDVIWERLVIVFCRIWTPTVQIAFSFLEASRAVKDYIAEIHMPVGVVYTCNFCAVLLAVLLVWRYDLHNRIYNILPFPSAHYWNAVMRT